MKCPVSFRRSADDLEAEEGQSGSGGKDATSVAACWQTFAFEDEGFMEPCVSVSTALHFWNNRIFLSGSFLWMLTV